MTADTPIRRSPLGAETAEPRELASGRDLTIRELPFRSQVDLRLAPDAATLDEVEKALGVRPSTMPNRASGGAGLRALWLGPDEWLVIGGADDPDVLERRIVAAVAPLGGTAVEVSAARTIIELDGLGVRDLLARGCSLDLHPAVFTAGHCAQTILAHVDVILDCLEADRIQVFVRASFTPYLAAWLADALALMDAVAVDSGS